MGHLRELRKEFTVPEASSLRSPLRSACLRGSDASRSSRGRLTAIATTVKVGVEQPPAEDHLGSHGVRAFRFVRRHRPHRHDNYPFIGWTTLYGTPTEVTVSADLAGKCGRRGLRLIKPRSQFRWQRNRAFDRTPNPRSSRFAIGIRRFDLFSEHASQFYPTPAAALSRETAARNASRSWLMAATATILPSER